MLVMMLVVVTLMNMKMVTINVIRMTMVITSVMLMRSLPLIAAVVWTHLAHWPCPSLPAPSDPSSALNTTTGGHRQANSFVELPCNLDLLS